MAGLVPDVPSCCNPCEEPVSVAVPGPQGPAGENGTNGTDGVDAFTTASLFVMPAELANVVVTVADSTWMAVGQIVFASAGGAVGYFEVISKPTDLTVTLQNLEDTANDAYPDNSAPGTNFPNGTQISPAGVQGPTGALPAGALIDTNNLSDVDDVATSRSNLGLGDLAQQNTVNNDDWSGADLAVANGGTGASDAATARSNLGAAASGLATASGLTVSTGERILGKASGAPAGAVEEIVCTTFAQSLLNDPDAATARATLGVAAAGAYAFSAIQTAPQGFANITLTQLDFDAEEYDVQNVWDTTASEYTAPADGLFAFKAQVFWAGVGAGVGEFKIEFHINGTKASEVYVTMEANAAGIAGLAHFDMLDLSAADVVTIHASQTTGGGESTDNTASATFVRGWAIST